MQTILVDPGLTRTGSRTTEPALGPARGGFMNLDLASAVLAVMGELRTDPRPILTASIHRVATQPGQVGFGCRRVWGGRHADLAGEPWPAPVLGRRSARCGLRVDRNGLGSGACAPRRSCDQTRDPPENNPQDGVVGAGRRQVKPDLGLQLNHSRGDLEQAMAVISVAR